MSSNVLVYELFKKIKFMFIGPDPNVILSAAYKNNL